MTIRTTASLAALATAAALVACSTNPTTGRKVLALGHDQEVAIGNQAAPQLTQEFGGEVSNAALRNYVTEIGMKLKDQTEADGPQRQWTFTLLNSDVINAFALPGEKVFVTVGICDKMTTEAQLAGVIGHEIGHVMAQHVSERIAHSQTASIGSAIIGAVAGATLKNPTLAEGVPALVDAGGQLIVLKFSRDQESESDSLGMRYMTKAGYNPRGQLEVMEILKTASGGAAGVEWMQTHPLPETRIDRIRELLRGEYAYTQSGPDSQKYQEFPDRFRQRYLSQRGSVAPARRRGAMLPAPGDLDLGNPVTWCAVCAANAGQHVNP